MTQQVALGFREVVITQTLRMLPWFVKRMGMATRFTNVAEVRSFLDFYNYMWYNYYVTGMDP